MAGEGKSLGQVHGRIGLKTDSFAAARQKIVQDSKLVYDAVNKIGESAAKTEKTTKSALGGIASSFDRAAAAAKKFDNTSLGKINKGLKEVQSSIMGISVAAGALAVGGLAASNSIRKLEVQFAALLGSQEKAAAEMQKLRKFADDLNVPYTQVLEAAAALTPLVKASGAEFNKLLITTQKLATIDPAQGVQGARVALSEFMSGDITSIFRRFELGVGKDAYRKIVEESAGDVNKMLDGLNEILDKTGITTDAIREMADPFALLADEGKLALDAAFRPFLMDFLIPAVKELTGFLRGLRETSPEILKFGAGFTIAVAAAAPLLGIMTSLISSAKTLKMLNAGGGILGKLAGGAGLIAKGATAGVGAIGGGLVAKSIADSDFQKVNVKNAFGVEGLDLSTNDLDRIRSKEKGGGGEDVMAVVGERLKQATVIIAKLLIDAFKTFVKLIATAINAFDQFITMLHYVNTFLREFGASIRIALGDLMQGIANLLGQIPGLEQLASGLLTSGADTKNQALFDQNQARNDRADLEKKLSRGLALPPEVDATIDAVFKEVENGILGGLTDMLFPVKQAAEETAQGLEDAGETVSKPMQGDSEEFIQQQAEEITEAVKSYNTEIEQLELQKQQNILDINKRFADDQIQIAKDRVKAEEAALLDLERDRAKMLRDFNNDTGKAERDQRFKELEKVIDFQRKERDAAQAHVDKLEDIRNKARQREQEALLNLDFAALFQISEDTNTEMASAQGDFDRQRQERSQALADETSDMMREFEHQRNERAIEFQNQLNERSIAYHQQREDIQRQTAERLQMAQQAHQVELQQLQQKYQAELSLRQQAIQKELEFLMMSERQRQAFLQAEQQKLLNQAANLYKGANTAQSVQRAQQIEQARPVIQKTVEATRSVVQNVQNSPLVQAVQNLFGRATGGSIMPGNAYSVNEPHSSLMERVLSGGRVYNLPGAGVFLPTAPGAVDANRGSGQQGAAPQVTVQLNAPVDSGLLTIDEAIALINQGVQQGSAQLLARMAAR